MRRELSSFLTIFYKFILTSIFIGMSSLSVFLGETCLILFTLGFAFLVYFLFGTLKKVEVDENNIYVSNYFKVDAIPLSNIENVSDVRLLNVRRITVQFKQETKFGYAIDFAPVLSADGITEEHPVSKELKRLAKLFD